MADKNSAAFSGERSTAVEAFKDRAAAEVAIAELERVGFARDQIGFAMKEGEATIKREMVREAPGTHAGEDAVSGAIGGGVLGGIIGAAIALLVPGIGPVLAGGILASVFGGLVAGTVARGILGALIGMGVPEHEARFYEQELRSGRAVVTVNAGARYQEACDILRRKGASEVEGMAVPTSLPEATRTSDMPAPMTDGWESASSRYRTQWEERYVKRWEDYEPAYRYGYEVAHNPMFASSSWSDVEPYMQRGWEARYPHRPWDEFRETIREVWDDVHSPPSKGL